MGASDDAFSGFLASLGGQAVGFLPGLGGIDDALTSLAFWDLCRRHGIACVPFRDAAPDNQTVVVGSLEVASRERRRLDGRRVFALPGGASGSEDLGGVSDGVTAFWRDSGARELAVLRGMRPDRAVLCRHPAIHLDAAALAPARDDAEGTLTLNVHARPRAASGDHVLVGLDGRGDRWASPQRCLSAVRGAAALIAAAAEVRTDSPGLAIVAARLGKAVRLSRGRDGSNRSVFDGTIAALFPTVELDPEGPDGGESDDGPPALAGSADGAPGAGAVAAEVARLKRLLMAARREAQHLAQERERLFIEAAELRDRRDAGSAAALRSHRAAAERAEAAARGATERLAEAEARAARDRDAATGAEERLAAAEGSREAAARDAAADVAAREAAHEAARRDARVAAEARENALGGQIAASNAALEIRTHQALALQAAVDDRDARLSAAEGRVARMRSLIDARTAAADEARREAEALRRRLDLLASSHSWRVTRPLRGLSRGIKRLAGAAATGGRDG